MKKAFLRISALSFAFLCAASAVSAKTIKASKVDVKTVSKLIDGNYKPKLDKDNMRISIKSSGASFVKLNETKKIVVISSKWSLKEGTNSAGAAVLANVINSSYGMVQASYRDATRDEGETFVLETTLPYVGGLDSDNLNFAIAQYVDAAERLEELLK